MLVRVQFCWSGGENYYFRALVCGGLKIRTNTPNWTRKHAAEMLNLIETETGIPRGKIRFRHV